MKPGNFFLRIFLPMAILILVAAWIIYTPDQNFPKFILVATLLLITSATYHFLHITEQRKTERMKSEFISTVSHELRTPLTSISGALGLLSGGAMGELSSDAMQLVDIANKNCQRLNLLINDLLDLEKIAVGKICLDMQKQPLMPVIEMALEASRCFEEHRGVSFTIVERSDGVQVRVDVQRLIQALSNYLSNAAKFSSDGGEVRVSVRLHGSFARIEVTDDGPGIPLEFHDRIFQAFTQADASDSRPKGGTGLGLALVRELIELMGGNVGFHSVPGYGATFFLELPVQNQ